jgi:Uma2 family endonuclease
MARAAKDWTVDRVLALPDDGNRYEVVDGELLVSPSPELRHQAAVLAVAAALRAYLRSSRVGSVGIAPADISLDERTLVQPDVFVYAWTGEGPPTRWREVHELLLAVEVLSPSTARYDRHVKRLRYQRHGIAEYWIVDLDARLIERWRPGDERPEIVPDRMTWAPAPGMPPLVVDVGLLFEEIWSG